MYRNLSPHRMALPPPFATHAESGEPSALGFVSRIMLIAIAVAAAAALIVAAPATVIVPLASVLGAGVVASLVVASVDRRLSARRLREANAARRHFNVSPPAVESVRPWEAVGIMSVVLLLFSLVSPPGLRVVLSAAGLLGLVAFRLAAADGGWARRGLAWTTDTPEMAGYPQ